MTVAIGKAVVLFLGLGSLLALSAAEVGLSPLNHSSVGARLKSGFGRLAFLQWSPTNHLASLQAFRPAGGAGGGSAPQGSDVFASSSADGVSREPSQGAALSTRGSAPPPLSDSGPGSEPSFFMKLNEFSFPSENALMERHGLSAGKVYDKQFSVLRETVLGGGASRERIKRTCAKELDTDEKNGQLNQAPSEANLDCYFFRVERLAKKLEKEAIERQREDEERFELSLSEPVVRNPKGLPRTVRSQADWSRLAGLGYRSAVGYFRFGGLREALRVAGYSLYDQDPCATAGARSGLMRALEDFLPDEEVFETMGALYVHQKSCLRPNDDSFEEIHFRMGLLMMERGRLEEAGSSFGFALEDIAGRDAYRVLFWRGLLEVFRSPDGKLAASAGSVDTGKIEANDYWKRLIANYPLSFHALVADSVTGYSLHKKLLEQPTPWVAIYQGDTWDAHNGGAFLYSLFIAKRDERLMKAFGNFVIRALDPVNFEQGLFFGLAQKEAGFTRGAIKSMFLAASRYGNGRFNIEVLDLLYPRLYVSELDRHGQNVDLAVALSLMRQESSFNPNAASPARAQGLMQVLPGTARMMLGKRNINLFDPVQNIKAGSKYLNHLLKRYDNNYVHTIASYNAGPGKIVRWMERYRTTDSLLFADLIPYRETRNYVTGLLRNIHWYRVLLNGDNHKDLISSTDTATWTARSLVPDPLQWGIESLEQPINLVFEPVPDFRRTR